MKMIPFAAALSFFVSSVSAQEPAWTLKALFAKALANSERIAVSDINVQRAEALYRQTFGSAMPDVLYRHQTVWQDHPDGAGGGANGTSTRSRQNEGAFRIRKTGFTGYRELAAIQGGGSAVNQAGYQRQRVEQLLLGDVAAAYFGTLQSEENLAATRALVKLAEERLSDLRQRVRVGRSREAEALGTEYQISTLRSQLQEAERQVAGRRDLLGYLTGVEVAGPLDPETGTAPAEDASLESFLSGLADRPDLKALRENVELNRAAVKISRADFFPSVDVVGNYYTDRPGFRQDIDWDAALGIEMPLWSWGATRNAVLASEATLHQSQAEYQAAQRQANLEVRVAHRDFATAQDQMQLNARSVALARRDYELQARDERRGLVTSLDVLESLNRLNEAELAYNRAQLNVRLSALNLQLAAGESPGEILR